MFKYYRAETNDQEEYAFANGIIRKLDREIMTKELMESLLKSNDIIAALKILNESDFFQSNFDISSPNDYENALNMERLHYYDIIKNISKVSPFHFLYFTFASKYDFQNLKIFIKSKFLKSEVPEDFISKIYTIKPSKLKAAIFDEKFEEIPHSYEFLIKKTILEYQKHRDPEKIDFILDKERYLMVLNKIKEVEIIEPEELFMKRFIRMNIDLHNIINCIRAKIRGEKKNFAKEFVIPSGDFKIGKIIEIFDSPLTTWIEKLTFTDYKNIIEEGITAYKKSNTLMEIERLKDNFILNFTKIGKYITFGIEPIIGFITAKENDFKNIKIILSGKLNNISENNIKERLRDTYDE